MKTRRTTLKALSTACAVGLAGCTDSGGSTGGNGDSPTDNQDPQAEQFDLRWSHFLPEGHVINREGIEYFASNVEEATDDGIEFEIFPGGQLGGPDQQLELARSGTADVSFTVAGYIAGEAPLSSVCELPGTFPDMTIGAEAANEFARTTLFDLEFEELGVIPIFNFPDGIGQLLMKDTKVEYPSDLDGLTIRAGGDVEKTMFESVGASAVEIPSTEVYQALQQGTIDGVAGFPPTATLERGLHEQVEYMTLNLSMGSSLVLNFMNLDLWNSLSTDYQATIESVADESVMNYAEAYQTSSDEAIATFDEDDLLEAYEVSDDALEAWREAAEAGQQVWLDQRPDQGQEVLDAWAEQVSAVQ